MYDDIPAYVAEYEDSSDDIVAVYTDVPAIADDDSSDLPATTSEDSSNPLIVFAEPIISEVVQYIGAEFGIVLPDAVADGLTHLITNSLDGDGFSVKQLTLDVCNYLITEVGVDVDTYKVMTIICNIMGVEVPEPEYDYYQAILSMLSWIALLLLVNFIKFF